MLRNFTRVSQKSFVFLNTTRNLAQNFTAAIVNKGYINGKWVDSCKKEQFPVFNPANGEVIGSVPDMCPEDAQMAIDAAKAAFYSKEWKSLTARQRSDLLKKWFNLLQSNAKTIAEIMTAEAGKPLVESMGEVAYGNSFIEWYAEEARRIYGEVIPSPWPNREVMVIRQPLGVAALITPWNFPLAMITRKAGAALAAGCTLVIKPAEDTPLTCLYAVKLAEEAGFPKGVINVVTSKKGPPIGDVFCKSNDVDGISFTGSTEVGKLLYRNSADSIKKISLELGGNAPFIVFNSADLQVAVDGAMASKFRNCGQTCVSSNRFFIEEGIYNDFVSMLKKRVEALKISAGNEAGCQVGPLINQMQFKKISGFVEDAREKGATICAGGKALPELGELFYAPTLITDVKPNMRIYNEEVFGPVISIIKVKDEQEAMTKANDTRRGLAGYFFSSDIKQIFRVARNMEVGMIGVNEGIISAAEIPFGGVKESGLGREGGHHGIEEYSEYKYVCLGNLKFD